MVKEKIELVVESNDLNNADTENLHISNSQVGVYLVCPYQYWLLKIKGIPNNGGSIFTVFGTAIHRTLQEYLEVLYYESVKKAGTMNLYNNLRNYMIDECVSEEKKNKGFGEEILKSDAFKDAYYDGIEIINDFIKRRRKYFSTRSTELLAIEEKLDIPIINNIKFVGYIDVVIRDKNTGVVTLIDLKTSYMGWKDKKKKDIKTRMQLLLYKYFYSYKHNIPINMINTEFMILKRKVYDDKCEWTIPRMQIFVPPSSGQTIQKYLKICESTINGIFTEDGKYIEDESNYKKQKSDDNCKWCPYKRTGYCDQW